MDARTFALMVSSKGDEWLTDYDDVYLPLHRKHNFTTDPCTTPDNPLGCRVFYTKKDDGLKCQWYGNIFCNPPYGKHIAKWVLVCWHWAQATEYVAVMLIPARDDTRWYHDYICSCNGLGSRHYWDRCYGTRKGVECYRIQGRLRFHNPNHKLNTAPFPSMVVVFR